MINYTTPMTSDQRNHDVLWVGRRWVVNLRYDKPRKTEGCPGNSWKIEYYDRGSNEKADISLLPGIARSSNWLVVVFRMITPPDQTQLNITGCRNSERVQTDARNKQEFSYRKQIARQLRTQYAEGIYRHKYYTVTLKSRLRVTQGHWKWNHWIDHHDLVVVVTFKCGLEVTQGHWKWYHLKAWVRFPIRLP